MTASGEPVSAFITTKTPPLGDLPFSLFLRKPTLASFTVNVFVPLT